MDNLNNNDKTDKRIGNQFYKLRTKKTGPSKIYEDPEELWNDCVEYFEFVDSHPWIKYEAIKSGELASTLVEIPTQRPYTIHALCLYLGVNVAFVNNLEEATRGKDDDYNKRYFKILTRIRETIYNQK